MCRRSAPTTATVALRSRLSKGVRLDSVTCAPITRTIRSEVEFRRENGLAEPGVISCDNVITIPLDALDREPVGRLDEVSRSALDRALRYALGIVY